MADEPTIFNPHDATLWDQRFSHPEPAYGDQPSLFLVEHAHLFKPDQRVFVPADGEGRNGLWLARRGLDVTCVDLSAIGLNKIQSTADREQLRVQTLRKDLFTWDWPKARYDHIVAVYFHMTPEHRKRIHRAMCDALVPGGYIFLEAFHKDQFGLKSGGPRDPSMLFDQEMLRDDFGQMKIEVLQRVEIRLKEGRLHQGPAVLMRMLARADVTK
ncbi:MAG TPA: class I SAM-dependent methyltransferase [Kiritimatiellia bacterium]|nr:class I SAM-dependent methyltransferase [Kiritimatiellia bacterium]